MAITKVTNIQRLEVYPPADTSADDAHNAKHETVMVVYEDILDDSTDDDLPVVATRVKHLSKYVEDGGSATDYSGELQLVQDVCGAIWT
tara:strand:+ start:35 stop:301 length:267 start_codon:yes stop_codon:yes gene_type:complete